MFWILLGVIDENSSQDAVNQGISALDYSGSLWRMFGSLALIIALLIGSYLVLKKLIQGKLAKGGASRSIEILERRAISPKSVVYLLEVEGKKVLLAESQLEIQVLDRWTDRKEDRSSQET